MQCHVDYYLPLVLDEEFTVRASLCWSDGARLNVEYLILNEKGETAATGYTVQMFFHVRTHEPYLLTPPLFEACRERWRKGEFHA